MQKLNKKTIALIKVVCICLILILFSGVGVMAVTTGMNTVTIKLSNGYDMTVLTSKTNVKEILEKNNIILDSNEKVTPGLDEDITQTKTIKITDKSNQEVEIAKVSESGVEITLDEILNAYDKITEKIEVKEETIPFETVKKDISDGAQSTRNKVVQEGKDGIKKITSKVKYQNDTEIERIVISEEVIKEPVNKIIQVRSDVISSRTSTASRGDSNSESHGSGTVKIYKVTAYCPCSKCCGKFSNGQTSSGARAASGRTVAAPSNMPFGTKLNINGKTYVVEDRGGAIKGNRIDVYVNSHAEALAWGVKYLPVEVIE